MPLSNPSLPRFPLEDEIAFLTLHHLHQYDSNPDVANALQRLEDALTELQRLPTANDYTGAEHSLTYSQCSSRFHHVPPTYLRDLVYSRLREIRTPVMSLLTAHQLVPNSYKRPRPHRIFASKKRLIPAFSNNVAALIHQHSYLPMSFPLQPLALNLLPRAFRRLKRLVGHHATVFSTIFDHSSQLVISGSDDHLIKIWSTGDAFLQHTLRGHDSNITDIVRHPVRPIIVSASSDSTLRVWDVSTGAALHVLDGGAKEVNSVCFSSCPDRPYLVSGGADGTVRIWNANNFAAGFVRVPIPQPTRRTSNLYNSGEAFQHPIAFTSAVAPPSPRAPLAGASIVASVQPESSNNPVPIITSQPSSNSCSMPRQSLPHTHPQQPSTANLDSSQPFMSTASPTSNSIAPNITPALNFSPIAEATAPSSTENLRITLNTSNATNADNVLLPQPIIRNQGPASSMVSGTPLYEVLSVCFNAGATQLAVAGSDCLAYLYAVDPPSITSTSSTPPSCLPRVRLLTTLRGHSDAIIQVLFSRFGDRLATAGRDGTARIWKRVKARLPYGKKTKQEVAGMGSWDNILLDCRTHLRTETRSMLSGAASGSACGSIVPRTSCATLPVSLCAVSWSEGDKYVLTSSSDAKIRIWNPLTGVLLRVLDGHDQEAYVLDFHPWNENLLLTAGYDGKCIFWDLESGKRLRTFVVGVEDIPANSEGPSSSSVPVKYPSICDGQFSKNGLSFTVSDTSGAITIFGVGSVKTTARAPEEQYFANEQMPIRRDNQQRFVHETSGQLLHTLPKGLLCDRNYVPHALDRQPHDYNSVSTPVLNSGSQVATTSTSAENTFNENYRVLVARAREHRLIQEREGRRLLKEANRLRRLMKKEKERASLLHDTDPQYLALREFEVPDSDYEDSDADFDIKNANSGPDGSTSSSSDESADVAEVEDEIQPVKKTDNLTPRGTSKIATVARTKRFRPLKDRKVKRRKIDLHESGDDDEERNKDESPGFEVGSHESASDDNSSFSNEKVWTGASKSDGSFCSRPFQICEIQAKGKDELPFPKCNDFDIYHLPHNPRRPSSDLASLSHPQVRASRTLAGASIISGAKRLKISTRPGYRTHRTESFTSGGHLDGEVLEDRAVSQNQIERFQSTDVDHLLPSGDKRNLNGAEAVIGPVLSRNPSHTTERAERDGGRENRRKSTALVEDHQDDAASCYQSQTLSETGAKSLGNIFGGSSHDQASTRNICHSDKNSGLSPETEDKPPTVLAANMNQNDVSALGGIEKSFLSNSPAHLNGNQPRTRSRNGLINDSTFEYATTSFADIDEIAEQELELLNANRPKKRKRSRARIASATSEEEHSGDEEKEVPTEFDHGPGNRRLRRRRNNKLSDKDRVAADFDGRRRSLSSSDWLRSSSNRFTYVPQIGDDVMYFAEGHIASIEIARGLGVEPLADRTVQKRLGREVLDGTVLGKDCPPLRFRILGITYELPTAIPKTKAPTTKGKCVKTSEVVVHGSTVMVLSMRLENSLKRKGLTGEHFALIYFPVDTPEYIVLSSRVNAALLRSWSVGDRFRILFVNENRAWQYYKGTIRRVMPTLQRTVWNTVEVEYDIEGEKDMGSTDLVSPWELEPFDLSQNSPAASSANILPAITVSPGLLPAIASELDAIRLSDLIWRTQCSWMDSVSEMGAIPEYCEVVPYPIDFNIVMVRLCTGYYRHFNAFVHDVELLRNNAIRFHGVQSESGQVAIRICSRIMEVAERMHAYFTASMAAGASPFQNGISGAGGLGNPRSLLGMQVPMEYPGVSYQAPAQSSVGSGKKPVPLSVGSRQNKQTYIAPVGISPGAESIVAQRPWRTSGGACDGQTPGVFSNSYQAFVPTLPPTSPYGISGAPPTAGYVAHGGGRTKSVRQHEVQKGTGVYGPRASTGLSPITSGTSRRLSQGSLTASASLMGRSFPVVASSVPYRTSVAVTCGGSVSGSAPFVTTGGSQIDQTGTAPSSAFAVATETNEPVRIGNKHTTGVSVHTPSILPLFGDAGAPHSARAYSVNGMASPPLKGTGGSGGDGAVSITLPSGPIVASQNPGVSMGGASNRIHGDRTSDGTGDVLASGSNGLRGDGPTHSWSQSMEGAGGMLPLQASTSDSHLTKRGRESRGPNSPARHGIRGGNIGEQATSTIGNDAGGTSYHEHSIVSMAAAESTMSCGGAEGVLQAASAESFDMATSRAQSNNIDKVR